MENGTSARPTVGNTRQDSLPSTTTTHRMLHVRQRQKKEPKQSLHGSPETAISSVTMSSEKGKQMKQFKKNLVTCKLPANENPRRRAEPRQTHLSDYGLQEGREIPHRLYVNFLSEIAKIERQLKEENILEAIWNSREGGKIKENAAPRETLKLPTTSTLPRFSYFPDQPKYKDHAEVIQETTNEAAVDKQRVRFHQEKTSKKMKLFYRRYKQSYER